MEGNETSENWKQFQGTELGSLMSQIYGGTNKPAINYPKPKTKAFKPEKSYLPLGNNADSSDPRKSTKREVKLNVPKLGGQKHTEAEDILPIQVIPRRKAESVIMKELDDIRMRQEKYRPAYVQPISSDKEKDRLSQIFTYKGGKCLPSELVNPISEAPFEIKIRQDEAERVDKLRAKRGLPPKHSSYSSASKMSSSEVLAEQISKEINERREYIESMTKLGLLSTSEEHKIKSEITQRIKELQNLDV